MEKINVVLVMLNPNSAENAVKKLNLDSVNLAAIIMDNNKEKFFTVGENKVPLFSFKQIQSSIEKYKDFVWLISGYLNNSDDLLKMKKFLAASGLTEENIVNFEISSQVSQTWLANMQYVEEHGADFFATGNEFTRNGLNFKYIPVKTGVNLSDANQTLRQSYSTAKYVFNHVKPATVKFVIIGLSPDSFCYDNDTGDFFGFQHIRSLTNTTLEQADLNFNNIKKSFNRDFSAQAIADWEYDATLLPTDNIEKNIHILKDYIKLCLDNGAQPVGVVFPIAPAVRKSYSEEFLINFRETIHQLEEDYNFFCIDMFDLNLNYDSFCDMTHLNEKGMRYVNSLLALKLCMNNTLIPVENFCNMTYEYFYHMSNVAPKDEYNDLMERVFNISVKEIRRKDKIKLGFVTHLSSQWCGDDLYNLFANDERFDVTVFLCRPYSENELFQKDFIRGVEQFKSHGLNVVAIDNKNTSVPTQDVLISLTPYSTRLPKILRPKKVLVKTLIIHMPYAFGVGRRSKNYYNLPIFHTGWKLFFSSKIELKVYDETTTVGVPRGAYSGYPRMDIFFDKNVNFHFDWKMTRPDAKKIIWAPHWSINAVNKQATFQWNYQFMYEFAKAHPEISWVVKPHPGLFFSTVEEKIFPSTKAFENYLQKWNDLPNAQVYTGGYYQAIFATSDGMILDSCSFIAEYQFAHNPMIFLTRKGEGFNKLGDKILDASYLVDGKDLDGIAALLQKIFIEGDDYKADKRKEVFDNYLNYPKFNGMLASEFIYKSIADELQKE
ncbi:MAG: hypothetical protein IJQ85_07600 [Selenomonadaceae bacterium]|nr:hypothetical protein [Selenomonadaceae bacterium]